MNEREFILRKELAHMPLGWQAIWCDPFEGGCGCMGCANFSGGLAKLGYSAEEWLYVRNTPATVEQLMEAEAKFVSN